MTTTEYHSSLGVTTSKIMPLIGGLCHVQRTSTSYANMICPSSEDFVLYNGLRPLGNMICPSSEDFVSYNGLPRWAT